MCKETCRCFRGSAVQISLKHGFCFGHNLVYGPLIWMISVGYET